MLFCVADPKMSKQCSRALQAQMDATAALAKAAAEASLDREALVRELFALVDFNADGVLTRDEIERLGKAGMFDDAKVCRGTRGCGCPAPGQPFCPRFLHGFRAAAPRAWRQIQALFDGNDLNKDGKITVEEAVAYNVTTFEQLSDEAFQKHMIALAALAKKAAADGA